MSHQTSSKYAAGTIAISAKNLRKSYRSLTAVRGIDLDILEGSFFGLLGPNGAGKSSTIQMLHCSSPITSGSLELFGRSVAENERWVKSKLGVVSQDNNLDSELNVMENLLVYARYFGITRSEARTRAENALAFFQLSEYSSSSCEDLSGGMKRRLVIARALMSQPKVIILDEPTTGLDPVARQLVWQKLRELQHAGITLILTTHYIQEAEQLCDRIVIMDSGTILADDVPEKLVARHVGQEVLEIRPDSPLLGQLEQIAHRDGITYEMSNGITYVFAERHGLFADIATSLSLSLIPRRANLEDVFLRLTGRSLRD